MVVVAIFVVVLMFVLVWIVRKIRSDNIIERTTSVVAGTITSASRTYHDGEEDLFFVVCYQVNGVGYRLMQDVSQISLKEMRTHVGESVQVHYDPEKPRVAWAETPGRYGYINSKASIQ